MRNWRYGKVRNLLLGLPAVIILLGFLALSAMVRANPESIRRTYLASAFAAQDAGDFATAEVYLQRIIDDFGSNTPDVEFALAEVFESTGRIQRADGIYRRLAPDQVVGHSGAHGKRAVALADALTENVTAEELRIIKFHLNHADRPFTPDVARAGAMYHFALGEAEEAIEYLEEAVVEYPSFNLPLAEYYFSQQEIEKGRAALTAFADEMQAQLDADVSNDAVRINLANTQLRLGDLEESERLLLQGLNLNPEGPYQQLLALLYVRLHDMSFSQGATIAQRFTLLRRALDYDPTCAPAYERLLLYSEVPIDPENPDAGTKSIEQVLTEFLATGDQAPFAHFAMSMLKFDQGNVEACRQHLEIAHRLLPDMPFITNNLAYLLATEEPIDLERALGLMDPVIDAFPTDVRLLDTRATIHTKLRNWDNAYDDLTVALKNVGPSQLQIDLHEKLATVCDELGMSAVAAEHRRLAAEIELPEAPSQEQPELVPTTELETLEPDTAPGI